MANEFLDLFIQLFLSTGVWGYLGVSFVILICMGCAHTIRYSWLFLMTLEVLMAIEYLTLGSAYFWHIVLLVSGAIATVLIGLKQQ